jgi:DnaA-homolog protein
MKQLALDFASQSLPTLDNFVVGRNGELLANVQRLVAGQATERFLYLWGRPGSGRTHLLRGVVTALQGVGTAAAYVACTSDTRPVEGLERMDCVALDDVDRLSEDGQLAVFGLYNVLRERGAALLAGGGATPV